MPDLIRRRKDVLYSSLVQAETGLRHIAFDDLQILEARDADFTKHVLDARFGRSRFRTAGQSGDVTAIFKQTRREMAAQEAGRPGDEHVSYARTLTG